MFVATQSQQAMFLGGVVLVEPYETLRIGGRLAIPEPDTTTGTQ